MIQYFGIIALLLIGLIGLEAKRRSKDDDMST